MPTSPVRRVPRRRGRVRRAALSLCALRFEEPIPPRDLWARTAAKIEAEPRRRRAASGGRRIGVVGYASLVGALVVSPSPAARCSTASCRRSAAGRRATDAEATPIDLVAGEIQVLSHGDDGSLELESRNISQLCPVAANTCGLPTTADITTLGDIGSQGQLDAIVSPDRGQVVVVERGRQVERGLRPPAEHQDATPTPEATPAATPTPTGARPPRAPGPKPGGSRWSRRRPRPARRVRARVRRPRIDRRAQRPAGVARRDPQRPPEPTPATRRRRRRVRDPRGHGAAPDRAPTPDDDRAPDAAGDRGAAQRRGHAPARRRRRDRERRRDRRLRRRLLAGRDALRVLRPARRRLRRPRRLRLAGRGPARQGGHRRPHRAAGRLDRRAAAGQPRRRRQAPDGHPRPHRRHGACRGRRRDVASDRRAGPGDGGLVGRHGPARRDGKTLGPRSRQAGARRLAERRRGHAGPG